MGMQQLFLGSSGPSDPYFASVVSLLHFNGTNGSTTFTDVKGKTWTVNGNAQISTAQSKFGGASALFDGSGDWIDTPDHADFAFGYGDFTIEFFFRTGTTEGYTHGQYDASAAATNGSVYGVVTSNHAQHGTASGGTQTNVVGTTNIIDSAWHHFAQVRYGNTTYMFVDGVSEGTPGSISGALNNSTAKFAIGRLGEYTPYPFTGYIDEFRITKGVARYTANFTPPTAPFPDTGPAMADPHFASVVLLVANNNQSNGSTTFADQSSSPSTMTAVGAAQYSTAAAPTGMTSSLLVDGNGDYLSTPDSTKWNLGAGDWTIEAMVRYISLTQYGTIAGQHDYPTNVDFGWWMLVPKSADYNAYIEWSVSGVTSSHYLPRAWTPTTGVWYHIAYTRSGNNLRMFADGVQLGTTGTTSDTFWNSTALMTIGGNPGSTTWDHNGYLSNVRITKGVSRYNANFDVPVLPLPTY